jgi:hypothetical protein
VAAAEGSSAIACCCSWVMTQLPLCDLLYRSKIAEAGAAVSVNQKKWLVMHYASLTTCAAEGRRADLQDKLYKTVCYCVKQAVRHSVHLMSGRSCHEDNAPCSSPTWPPMGPGSSTDHPQKGPWWNH